MKKKVFSFLLLVVFCLTTVQSVYADMGAPMIREYEAFTSNPLGTKLMDYEKSLLLIIPYNTTLTVTSEFTEDGIVYANVTYLDKYGLVKLSDLSLKDDVVEPWEGSKQEKTGRAFVVEDNEIYLYSGPSKKYNVVSSKIPVGTTLEYNYADYDTVWVYTQYNGVKGWLYVYSYEFGPYGRSGIATLSDDAELNRTIMTIKSGEYLRARPDASAEKVSQEIPVQTRITYEYSYPTSLESSWLYCTYMGVSGWLYDEFADTYFADVQDPDKDKLLVAREAGAPLYKSPIDSSSALSVKVPEGKVLSSSARYRHTPYVTSEGWCYVSYNGTSAWLKESDVATPYIQQFKITSDTAAIQAYPSFSSEILDTLNADDYVTSIFMSSVINADAKEYDTWFKVKSGDITGWIFDDENLYSVGEPKYTYSGSEQADEATEQTTLEEEQSVTEAISETETVSETETSAEVTEVAMTETGLSSPVKTAVICISAAVVLSLTAFVVILLIKKKKG